LGKFNALFFEIACGMGFDMKTGP